MIKALWKGVGVGEGSSKLKGGPEAGSVTTSRRLERDPATRRYGDGSSPASAGGVSSRICYSAACGPKGHGSGSAAT